MSSGNREIVPPGWIARISLRVAAATSFFCCFNLIRSTFLLTVDLGTGYRVLLCLTGFVWFIVSATALICDYARGLRPSHTWLWSRSTHVILYLTVLWFTSFMLALGLCAEIFFPVFTCNDFDPCSEADRTLAIEAFIILPITLLISGIMTILVSVDLRRHSYITVGNSSNEEGYTPVQTKPKKSEPKISSRYVNWAKTPALSSRAASDNLDLLTDSPDLVDLRGTQDQYGVRVRTTYNSSQVNAAYAPDSPDDFFSPGKSGRKKSERSEPQSDLTRLFWVTKKGRDDVKAQSGSSDEEHKVPDGGGDAASKNPPEDADGKDDPSSESSAPATASANKEDDTPEQPADDTKDHHADSSDDTETRHESGRPPRRKHRGTSSSSGHSSSGKRFRRRSHSRHASHYHSDASNAIRRARKDRASRTTYGTVIQTLVSQT